MEKFIEIHGNRSRTPIQSPKFLGRNSLDQSKLSIEIRQATVSDLLRNSCNVRTVVHQQRTSSTDSKPHDVCDWRELGVPLENAMQCGGTHAGNFSEFGYVN